MPSRLIRRSSVYSDEGVVVLMDLGSALMSEMALEFLPEEQQDKICAEAPLVEGAIAAAVEAAGSDIKQVLAEAREALTAKAALGIVSNTSSVVSSNEQGQQTGTTDKRNPTDCSQSFRITRPSAQFVTTATRFQSQIRVRNLRDTEPARAESINQVATLGVRDTNWLSQLKALMRMRRWLHCKHSRS